MIEEKIPVQIFGQVYEIVGNPSESLYYHSLAQYVEEKMREIQDTTNIVTTQKIAVLSAVNIADELFREREKKSYSIQSVDKKHEELIHILDKILGEQSSESADHAHSSNESLLTAKGN